MTDRFFETVSEFNVKGNICETFEGFVKYMAKRKTTHKQYDFNFDDYRKINEKEQTNNVENQLGKLLVHVK